MSSEDSVAGAEQGPELTMQERCPELVIHPSIPELCGPRTGPFDISPVTVECTRTSLTDHFTRLTSKWPGGVECGTGETECLPWVCESCD